MRGVFGNSGGNGGGGRRRDGGPHHHYARPAPLAPPAGHSMRHRSALSLPWSPHYCHFRHFTARQAAALIAVCACFGVVVFNFATFSGGAIGTSLLDVQAPGRQTTENAGGGGIRRASLTSDELKGGELGEEGAVSAQGNGTTAGVEKKKAVREIAQFEERSEPEDEEIPDEALFSVQKLASEKHPEEAGGKGVINAPFRKNRKERGGGDKEEEGEYEGSTDRDDTDDEVTSDEEDDDFAPVEATTAENKKGTDDSVNLDEKRKAEGEAILTARVDLEDDDDHTVSDVDDSEKDTESEDGDESNNASNDYEEDDSRGNHADGSLSSTAAVKGGTNSTATMMWPEVDIEKLDPRIKITRDPGDDRTRRPDVAWLMSFPNSGTSFTIHMTREATNCTTATNYALEGEVPDLPSVQAIEGGAGQRGPFLELIRDRHTNVPPTILTKTHW